METLKLLQSLKPSFISKAILNLLRVLIHFFWWFITSDADSLSNEI